MKRLVLKMATTTVLLGLLLTGCSTNKAATDKCKQDKDCKACCKKHGASGNSSGTVNGKYGCRCLGG